jgi:predicted nuclease of predicted toxin-antitoxin system
MKFFLDANIPHSTLDVFEALKLAAVHAKDVDLSRADDKEIISYAAKNESILVTKDLEFANAKLFAPKSHNGVVILRFPPTFDAARFSKALKEFLTSVNIKALENAITLVKLGSYRIRKLW